MAISDWLLGKRRERPQHGQINQPVTPDLSSQDAPTPPAFAHAPQLPDGDFRFIALDVETACSNAASICQIGIACVQPDNQIQTFSILVNPRMRFDNFNIQLHGIGPEMVVDALHFPDALMMLLPLLTRHPLVQHSNFDKQAVHAACTHWDMAPPELRWSDSVTIARRAWPEWKGHGGHGLAHLKRRLDLTFHHHDAGEDARAAAMVVLHAEARLAMPFEQLILPAVKTRYPGKPTRAVAADGALAGSTVVFTGNLSLSREAASDMAARAGMTVKANVTRQITHLVVGDQDLGQLAGHSKSSKHRKAEEMQQSGHPVRIMGEREFIQVICGGDLDDLTTEAAPRHRDR